MTTITIYTDGASSGNPGPGGYGAVIIEGQRRREISGGFRLTTNNRMELFAAIAALESLKGSQPVRIYSDSQYLVVSFNEGRVLAWQAKGWHKTKKVKVLNADLWQRLLALLETHPVTFEWVAGHTGQPLNERANRLAQQAMLRSNLPADPGYEQAASQDGEIQAGLFDLSEKPNANDPAKVVETSPVSAAVESRKITRDGQLCRKCGTPVVKRTPARKLKPGQNYFYEYYFQCPNCATIYLVDDARRVIDK